MKKFSRKRAVIAGGAVVTIGAVAALLIGSTFGFFSSAGTASGSNTFTAGHVLVGLGTGTQVTCNIGPMSAGDSNTSGSNVSCKYIISYTGNVPAYLALDLKITGASGSTIDVPYGSTTAPSAAQGLYDGTSTGLQLNISDGTTTYLNGVDYKIAAGTPTVLTPTSGAVSVADLLMNTTPETSASPQTTLTVTYSLPTTAGNAYNLATSSIVMTVHAVQANNNSLPSACSIVGNQCDNALSGMNWS